MKIIIEFIILFMKSILFKIMSKIGSLYLNTMFLKKRKVYKWMFHLS